MFPECELWVGVDEGQGSVVGLMVLGPQWLEHLYVDPGHTGRGVGTDLLSHAKALRPGGLQLWTFASNGRARRFYERHGFVATEETDGSGNEEGAADVMYVWRPRAVEIGGGP